MSGEKNNKNKGTFADISDKNQQGIISEYIAFLKENRKYWMIPILIALLFLGGLLILGGTSAAPFIYTLF